MAISSMYNHGVCFFFFFLIIITLCTLSLLSSAVPSPISAPEGMLVMEDKIRLGSTPPSCHNRCNECNPCTAVQVPTLPQGFTSAAAAAVSRPPLDDRASYYSSYSNYKPLGWKCRCGNHLFNP